VTFRSSTWWAGYARVYDRLWRGPLTDRLAGEIQYWLGPDAGRVLDAGTGTGLILGRLGRVGEVVGMDASEAMLKRAGRRHSGLLVQGDVHRPPFAAGTFDTVVAANVLHLSGNPDSVVNALLPLVRPGGRLVFCWPCDQTGPWQLHRSERAYGARTVEALLRLFLRYAVGLSAALARGPRRVPTAQLFDAIDRAIAAGGVGHASEVVLDNLTHLVILRPIGM